MGDCRQRVRGSLKIRKSADVFYEQPATNFHFKYIRNFELNNSINLIIASQLFKLKIICNKLRQEKNNKKSLPPNRKKCMKQRHKYFDIFLIDEECYAVRSRIV